MNKTTVSFPDDNNKYSTAKIEYKCFNCKTKISIGYLFGGEIYCKDCYDSIRGGKVDDERVENISK